MGGFAEYELIEDDDGATVLVLSGPYLVSTIGAIDQDLRVLDGPIGTIDLSAISEIDTVGAWVACSLSKTHDAEIVGASDRAKRLVGALEGMSVEEDITAPRLPVWERVPQAVGDFMILDAGRKSGGVAMSAPEGDILNWMKMANAKEGIALCPETAVCLGVLDQLMGQGKIKPKDRVLIFNTGAAQKYLEAVSMELPRLSLDQPIDWTELANRPSA